MGKRVVDLTAEELEKAAGEAWDAAAQEALAKGLPVAGSGAGTATIPGRVENLGPVASHPVIVKD